MRPFRLVIPLMTAWFLAAMPTLADEPVDPLAPKTRAEDELVELSDSGD